jgi:hypothetical protein
MKLLSGSLLFLIVGLLTACGSTPTVITYDANITSEIDYLALPVDAPQSVELTNVTVPKLDSNIQPDDVNETRTAFNAEEVIDGLGQKSLKLNRGASTSWELVDQALSEQGIKTRDRNRSEYRFELGSPDDKGFFSRLFSKKTEPLSLVLIPSGEFTLLSLESGEDSLPEADDVDRVFSSLLDHWAAQAK